MTRNLLPLLATLACSGAPAQEAPPHILVIVADDQRADSIGAYGEDPAASTPHLDALARRGLRFDAAANLGATAGAVCIAARAMLLTGRGLFQVSDNPNLGDPPLPTLGELFRGIGYGTFATGKWHNGASLRRCFPEHEGVTAGFLGKGHMVDARGASTAHVGEGEPGALSYSTDWIAARALAHLERMPADRPNLVYVAFNAPHDPREELTPWLERHAAAESRLPPNVLPAHPFDTGDMAVRDERLLPTPRPMHRLREEMARYRAMVSHVDDAVGSMLAVLARRGLLERTIVVYTADQGLALGSHGLLGKQNVYEPSLRCPLIIAGPGIRVGTRAALVALPDLLPTLLGLAGRPDAVPTDIAGRDLRQVMDDPQARVRDRRYHAYYHGENLQQALREGDWKLIRYRNPAIGERWQLFDLARNPHEILADDLAGDPAQAGRLAQLRAAMRTEQLAAGDPHPLAPQ